MIATLVLFPNADLSRDTKALRDRMFGRDSVYGKLPGLRSKTWVNDVEAGEFGAFLVWESPEALEEYRAGETNAGLAEFWGAEPVVREFDVYQILDPDGAVIRT